VRRVSGFGDGIEAPAQHLGAHDRGDRDLIGSVRHDPRVSGNNAGVTLNE